jgi:hypothetical protein
VSASAVLWLYCRCGCGGCGPAGPVCSPPSSAPAPPPATSSSLGRWRTPVGDAPLCSRRLQRWRDGHMGGRVQLASQDVWANVALVAIATGLSIRNEAIVLSGTWTPHALPAPSLRFPSGMWPTNEAHLRLSLEGPAGQHMQCERGSQGGFPKRQLSHNHRLQMWHCTKSCPHQCMDSNLSWLCWNEQ